MVRITQSMQIARTLRDQYLNLEKMNEYNNNMTDGVTLHRPSDDPIRVGRAMRQVTELRVNETYKSDLDAAVSWTSKTDDSLRTLSSIIKRVRELTVQASSGTLKTEDKQKIKSEYEELKKSAINVGNDDYMGRYQFSGLKTDLKFLDENGKYNKNLDLAGLRYEKIDYNIGVGQRADINMSGVQVFGNEHFGTKVKSNKSLFEGLPDDAIVDNRVKFSNGTVTINLTKYKLPNEFTTNPKWDSNTNLYKAEGKYTQPDAQAEDSENHKLEEKYEKITKLKDPSGATLTFTVNLSGEYTVGDVNAVVNDLNKQLKTQLNTDELKNSVQFVNDNGKIAVVSDKDYSADVTSQITMDYDEIQRDANGQIQRNASGMPITTPKQENKNDALPNGNGGEPERAVMPFFEMMDRLIAFAEEGNSKGLSRMLDVVDMHAKNNQQNQGLGGARTRMYEIMLSRTEDIKLNYTDLLSKNRDTNYSEMVMKMNIAKNVYRASLAVTAKIIQPSLVDFLR